MIEIKDLNKSYGSSKVLRDINLTLEEDKIYGLLGRNGVGKSTLLNIMSNGLKSSSGRVMVDGEDVYENAKLVEDIAMVKEDGFGVEDLKIKKLFQSARILYKNWDEDYANFLIKDFNFNMKKKYNKLSRGNKTLLGLIIGLASRAPLTLFDEPSLGLDAAYRYKFYNLLLKDVEENPRTVIISTHLIDEVTNLFEEIIIIKEGRVLLKDDIDSLMEKAYTLNGRLENIMPIIKDKNIIGKEEFGASIIVNIFDNLSTEEKASLREKGVDIGKISLQKLFVLLTEDNLEEGVK